MSTLESLKVEDVTTKVSNDVKECFECKKECLSENSCSDTYFKCLGGKCNLICDSKNSCNNLMVEIRSSAKLLLECVESTIHT